MPQTAVIYTPKYLEHNPGRGHPESANRLKVIMAELERSGLLKSENCSLIAPKPAEREKIELVHKADYIQLVKNVCDRGGGLLDLGDTVASPESFNAAVYAVGGALKAVDLVMNGKFKNAFAFVRPPGHHAGPSYACGFCIFNNIAIAAKHLLEEYGLERVLILDIDAHHGNGTQEIFYSTNKALYISLHQDPRGFPGTGFLDETGKRDGLGYTVNIPFPFRTPDEPYLRAINGIVLPIIEQYSPQFILMSVGFDAHYSDPIASLSLSSNAYIEVFKKILDMAQRTCNTRLAAILEGGYGLSIIGRIAAAVVSLMAGLPYSIEKESPARNERALSRAENVLREVKNVQSNYWRLD